MDVFTQATEWQFACSPELFYWLFLILSNADENGGCIEPLMFMSTNVDSYLKVI